MTWHTRPTRRAFLLSGLAIVAALEPARAQLRSGDQGIGGTGVVPAPQPPGDRGIGGTGVIGTIRRFGSIWVNGLRIGYAPDVQVSIDGEPAKPSDMKIGHVAQAIAVAQGDGLSTRRIDIASEVAGRVESVAAGRLVVLGQQVDTRALGKAFRVAPGAEIAVFGQRRPNGVIVASLVEPRVGTAPHLTGPVRITADNEVAIGDLVLRGVPASLEGTRIGVQGAVKSGELTVTRLRDLARPFGNEVQRVSIEAYVTSRDRGLTLGSGLVVLGAKAAQGAGASLSILTARVDPVSGYVLQSARADRRNEIPERSGPAGTPQPDSRGRGHPSPGGQGGLPTPGGPGGSREGARGAAGARGFGAEPLTGPGGMGPGGMGPGGMGPGGMGPGGPVPGGVGGPAGGGAVGVGGGGRR